MYVGKSKYEGSGIKSRQRYGKPVIFLLDGMQALVHWRWCDKDKDKDGDKDKEGENKNKNKDKNNDKEKETDRGGKVRWIMNIDWRK